MKKNVLITLVALLFVLITAYIVVRWESGKDIAQIDTITPLFKDLDIEKISGITINSGEDEVILTFKDDLWIVSNKSGYAADFKKIHELVFNLSQLRPSQFVTNKKERYKRFGVQEIQKEGESKCVTFNNKENKKILEVILGKERKGKTINSSQYIRRADSDDVYLISKKIDPLVDSKSWLKRELVDVKAEEIKSIVILHPTEKDNIILKRKNKEDSLELSSIPEGKKLKSAIVNSISNAISSLRLDDVSNRNEDLVKDIKFNTVYTATLFNGMVYNIKIGKKEDKSYVKIKADYIKPKSENDKKNDDANTSTVQSPEELALKARKESEFFSNWVYVIPAYKGNSLLKKKSDLYEL